MSSLDSAENFEEHSSSIQNYADEPKKRGRKAKGLSDDDSSSLVKKALKISLDEEKFPEGLQNLLASQKEYSVKYDIGEIILEALSKVSAADWAQMSDDHIPMNVKIMAAMENPEMREKLKNLLNTSKLSN